MNIINNTKIWLLISTAVVAVSILAMAMFGLKLGIDFTGGSLLEVYYLQDRPTKIEVETALVDLDIGNILVQDVDDHNILLRFKNVSEEKHQEILSILSSLGKPTTEGGGQANAIAVTETGEEVPITIDLVGLQGGGADDSVLEELRFDSVGPSIGAELKQKSIYAMIIVLIVIIVYVAYSFRAVSKPIASWKYGIAAIVALFHDVLIVAGIFALLGRFAGIEIDIAFIAALLTVLGYSVNDTIVVFDRIRENLPQSETDFAHTVNRSLNQTIGRSINTSITTLLVLLAIFFFGGATIKFFILALIIGVISGTYSSIFLASPLLVVWEKMQK